jgi:hypothetical protein
MLLDVLHCCVTELLLSAAADQSPPEQRTATAVTAAGPAAASLLSLQMQSDTLLFSDKIQGTDRLLLAVIEVSIEWCPKSAEAHQQHTNSVSSQAADRLTNPQACNARHGHPTYQKTFRPAVHTRHSSLPKSTLAQSSPTSVAGLIQKTKAG